MRPDLPPPPVSPLERWDARWRIGALLLLAASFAIERPNLRSAPDAARDLPPAAACLAVSIVFLGIARVRVGAALRRVRAAAALLVLVAAVFPLAYAAGPPTADATSASLPGWSPGGFVVAGAIALRGLAIVLLAPAALAVTRPAAALGALRRIGAPRTLVETSLFAARYLTVSGEQYRRMRLSMRARGFVARGTFRTLRVLANAVAMLLVSGVERVERVSLAMKARGYEGEIRTLDRSASRAGDIAAFGAVALLAAALIVWRVA